MPNLRVFLNVSICFVILLSHNKCIAQPSVLISSPFDNFRIECPRYSGVQRLSIRMIESQGMKRQDTVFAISCNHIEEVHPLISALIFLALSLATNTTGYFRR